MKGINTITANFSNGGRQCITRKLFQYDYGQKVLIKGLTLPQSFEFHISNSNNPKASSNIFLGNNNEIIIPDEYLTSGEDIYIWIFLHQTASDGQTRYTINIPIQKRPKAESKEPTQVEQNVIDQLISALEQKVDEISTATEQAKDTFLKYPKIVDDYWYAYDIQTKNWINTEAKALGEDGLGIKNVSLNNDYTLTITFTDDTVFTTESIRGQKGQKGDTGVTPNLTVGTIETLPAEGYASVNIKGTAENPVLDFKIPRGYKGDKGDTGVMPNITIGTVNNLEPGSVPYVTQTGTTENPVLTFGLVKGEKGDTGPQGIQGPKGDKGDTGEQGPQGLQGPKGDTGPQGEKGQKGDQGIQGVRGQQGYVGPRGQKGDTPQKGADYWTAADKLQMIEDVLASQDITDLKNQIDSKEDALNYSNPVQGFALTAKTIENGKVTEWDFGETGGIKMHICSSAEYSSESRIPIINNPDEKTIYLVPASYQPSNNMFTEWVYVNNTWEIFGSVAVDLSGYLTDVQINGTSIVTDGVAEIPFAEPYKPGVIKVPSNTGLQMVTVDRIGIKEATLAQLKAGTDGYFPVVPRNNHQAIFYGLAKAAGDTTQAQSSNAVGTYTDDAKTAIQNMLGVPSNSDITSLQTAVQSKADAQTVTTLSGVVSSLQTSKADKSYVDTQLAGKASTATATASTNGLMSAQDKSKLDAVYDDYTAALTIADGSLTGAKLADGTIPTAKIADGAITTAKIADGAITAAKLSDSSVSNGKLASNSVTTAKIADGAVTKDKLSNDITFETDKTLSIADMAADAKVTGNKISTLDNAVFTVSETPLYFDSKDSGGRIKANGSWEAASGYEVAKYEVSEGEYVKIIAHERFQFQTVTRLPSGTNTNIVGGTYDAGEYSLEVPSTAKFLLLAKKVEDTSVGAYPVAVSKNDVDAVKSIFLASENGKLTYFTVDNEYVTTSGAITHHALRKRSDYIPVKQLSHITMSIGVKSTYNCFYDAEKNFINSFAIEVEPTDIVVPQNAEYMIVSADKENFDTISGTVTYRYDREWVKPIGDRCGIYTAEASDVFDFEEGWIVNGANVSNRGAVRTKECVTLPYDIILLPTGTNQIHYAVWMYASDNTTVIAKSGVIYVPYVIPAGSNFRLAVGHYSGAEKPYLKNKNELLKYLFVADSYYSLTHIFDTSLKDNPNGIYKMPFLEESHRGIGSTSLPDNTYWAIVNSAKYGLGAIEIDIRTTSDNVIVLWHDATVSGKIDGQDTTLTIANETYATLSQLVLSTHWAYGDIKICTFDDALNLIWKYGLYVNLDCKDISPTAVASKIISNNLSGKAFYFNVGADIVNIIPNILAIDNKAKIGTVYHEPTLENIKNSGVDMRKIIVWQYETDVTADTYANIKSYGCDFLLAGVDKNSIQKAMIYHPDIVEYNSMSANAIREAQNVFRNL